MKKIKCPNVLSVKVEMTWCGVKSFWETTEYRVKKYEKRAQREQ